MLKALVLPYDYNLTHVEDAEQENKQHDERNHYETPVVLHRKGDNGYGDTDHRGSDQHEQPKRDHGLGTEDEQSRPHLVKGVRKQLELLRCELIRLQSFQVYPDDNDGSAEENTSLQDPSDRGVGSRNCFCSLLPI